MEYTKVAKYLFGCESFMKYQVCSFIFGLKRVAGMRKEEIDKQMGIFHQVAIHLSKIDQRMITNINLIQRRSCPGVH